MATVTQRIKQIKQPRGGYINPKQFTIIKMVDHTSLYETENIHISLVGMAVDYMTRFSMGANLDNVFRVSLLGAQNIGQLDNAKKLLHKIKGLDNTSLSASCKLSGYDVCYRSSIMGYRPVEKINPNTETLENIRCMVNRSKDFFSQYGPIVKNGFTFEGAYTNFISAGDGDFLTENTLWDFKVLNKEPTKSHSLQLLVYYLMGTHSIHKEFQNINQLGIFNPRLNNIYLLKITDISEETMNLVSKEVIGY